MEKEVIYIEKGVIALIEDNGEIKYYRQIGITDMPDKKIYNDIDRNKLDDEILEYKEIPKEYSIYFEDESIMGKAENTYRGV